MVIIRMPDAAFGINIHPMVKPISLEIQKDVLVVMEPGLKTKKFPTYFEV